MASIVDTIARFNFCTFTSNFAPGCGGALYIEEAPDRVEIWDCVFESNSAGECGGAMYVEWGWLTRIDRCRFTGNAAEDGGAFYGIGARPEIESSLFAHNQATGWGGALAGLGAEATNCTFVGNHSGRQTGGAISTSSPSLNNCIIWGNTTAQPAPTLTHQQVSDFDQWTFRDCIIAGYTDRWNLSLDPMFRSPTDFRLQPGSPAINIANGWYLKSWSPTDPDGNPRTVATFVDAGCYESDLPAACGPADLGGQPIRRLPEYRIPDGRVDNNDFFTYIDAYSRGDRAADLTRTIVRQDPYFGVPDGILSHTDFFYYLMMFEEGCR